MHGHASPISNRAGFALPADGKVHVVPLGEYPVEHNGRQIVQVVDDRACQAILSNLHRDVAAGSFAGLCCDFDHLRHDPAQSSRAAGWVLNAERRADGIYTAPRWSTSGRAALEHGDYRFISPEFDPHSLEALGGNRYRVTRLVGFGLTNSPNMRGMVPLTNRITNPDEVATRPRRNDAPQHVFTTKGDGTLAYLITSGANGLPTRSTTR